jgi:hypothetical protein
VGALANLGYTISDQTVGNILKRHGIPPAPQRTKTVSWREFIRSHMDVLEATEFFSSAVWSSLRLLLASLLSCLHCGLCKGYAVGRMFLCYGGRRQLLSPWSPYGQRDAEKRGDLVRAEAPSQRMLFGARVIQPLLYQSKTPHTRAPLPQGLERVVLLPVAHRHQRRDGPLQDRQRWRGLGRDGNREAA